MFYYVNWGILVFLGDFDMGVAPRISSIVKSMFLLGGSVEISSKKTSMNSWMIDMFSHLKNVIGIAHLNSVNLEAFVDALAQLIGYGGEYLDFSSNSLSFSSNTLISKEIHSFILKIY